MQNDGQLNKTGSFDWILQYEDIKKFLEPEHTLIETAKSDLKVLVVGCGTSKLSNSLVEESNFGEVVSIDNDPGCIEHMKACYTNPRHKWYVYDIVEGFDIMQHNCLDLEGWFDIVVDKGTFDAILVEGSVADMLRDIVRKLRVGGVYIVFSIFQKSLLSQILGIECLRFGDVKLLDIDLSVYTSATVAICIKTMDSAVDLKELASREKEILDQHYQQETPLVTSRVKDTIRAKFGVLSNGTGVVTLPDAHKMIFEENAGGISGSDYSYDLFEEDLRDFPLKKDKYMSIDEAVQFLEEMQ